MRRKEIRKKMRYRGKTFWRKRRDKILEERMIVRGRALDVGCGWRKFGWDAVRIDINPEYRPDVVGDIEGPLGLRDASFDTVLALDVLEHVRRPFRAVAEVTRVLKPGGTLFLTVPFCYPRHGTEYYRFTELGLRDMLEGFDAEIVPIVRGRLANFLRNCAPGDRIVEGYFVAARKKGLAAGVPPSST
jgi:SAM-dependent methyltransferase